MNSNLNLNWLRTFEAVARCAGFTAASKELGLTQTAVSLQIKALETKLGHDLFIRRAKTIQLTEVGKAYLPSIRNTLEALALSTNGLFGPDLTSTIVVRASIALTMWLTPRLKSFQELYPDIGIKFVTAIWVDAVETQSIDVDIILAPNDQAIGNTEKLSDEFIVPICGADTADDIKSIEDFPRTNPIHILGFDDHWSRYMSAQGLSHDVRATRLLVDTSVAACQMVAAGLGTAIIIERFANSAIQAGNQIRISGNRVALGQSHYMVGSNPPREKQTETAAFKDWLRDQF